MELTSIGKLVATCALAGSICLMPALTGCSSPQDASSSDDSANVEETYEESGVIYAGDEIALGTWESFAVSSTAAVLGDAYAGGVGADESEDAAAHSPSDTPTADANATEDIAHLNTCYSPVSLYYALALCAEGADGEAQQQLLELLGASDAEELAAFCEEWMSRIEDTPDDVDIEIANSIWANSGFSFKPDYVQLVEDAMDGGVFNADFGTDAANQQISDWISDQTEGLLKPEISTLADDVARLINTIYFKDGWQEPFMVEGNTEDAFHAETGDVQATFMHKTDDSATYAEGGLFTAAQMPFSDGATMTFYLPNEGVTPAQLLQDSASVQQLYNVEFEPAEVTWSVPKFTIDSSFPDLINALRALGVTDIFDPSISGMFANMIEGSGGSGTNADSAGGDFYVSEVIQETHLGLDENGVEAAAYTSMGIRTTALMPDQLSVEFTLDRPFVYTIQSVDGVTLFTGCVYTV